MLGGFITAILCVIAYFDKATENMNNYNKRKEAYDNNQLIYMEHDSLKERAVSTNEVVWQKVIKGRRIHQIQYVGVRSGKIYKVRDLWKEKEDGVARMYAKLNEELAAKGKQYRWIRWEKWDGYDGIEYARVDLANNQLIYDLKPCGYKCYIKYCDSDASCKLMDRSIKREISWDEYIKYYSL